MLDAAVVAKPDPKWGEVPCAFVELREGASVGEEELRSWSRKRLAGFKVPRSFVFGPLPKTSTGKVQKFRLRDSLRSFGTLGAQRPSAVGARSSSSSASPFGQGSRRRLSTATAAAGARSGSSGTASGGGGGGGGGGGDAGVHVASHTGEDGVTTIRLLNGRRRNPLCSATMTQLTVALLSAAEPGSGTRAVLLTASGPAFSAGHDLAELRMASELTGPGAAEASLEAVFGRCERLMAALHAVPVPVVAAVQGPAFAAGCQLVAGCDLVVADAARATFATPGVKIGAFCHTPAVSVVRALGGGAGGARRAAGLLYTGEPISAETAQRIGLVHELAPEGEALGVAERLAGSIASYSTYAMREGKAVLRRSTDAASDGGFEAGWSVAAAAMVRDLRTPDATEGIGAFLEKRPPTWMH